mmetsp:Transcript_72548/g.234454  ORF Transcript_72548/g.234454 Transcript_72548/m.234454 type:complete len:285 (-) Transcript_72548:139-993(-)
MTGCIARHCHENRSTPPPTPRGRAWRQLAHEIELHGRSVRLLPRELPPARGRPLQLLADNHVRPDVARAARRPSRGSPSARAAFDARVVGGSHGAVHRRHDKPRRRHRACWAYRCGRPRQRAERIARRLPRRRAAGALGSGRGGAHRRGGRVAVAAEGGGRPDAGAYQSVHHRDDGIPQLGRRTLVDPLRANMFQLRRVPRLHAGGATVVRPPSCRVLPRDRQPLVHRAHVRERFLPRPQADGARTYQTQLLAAARRKFDKSVECGGRWRLSCPSRIHRREDVR